MSKQRIAVGMSGGVDSSLAALLLREQGHEIVGVTLRMLPDDDGSAVERARIVATQLGITHVVGDCRSAFASEVLRRCYTHYQAGETPNPCVICNHHIKFGWLQNYAQELGCTAVATGHYARLEERDGIFRLAQGVDRNKDQSYFLCALDDEQRSRILFPLGNYTKGEVRCLALERGLASARDSDSQDICFDIHGGIYPDYLRTLFGPLATTGVLRDGAGKELAHHAGTQHYTIGQRKGLGVALGTPAFVCAINPETHDVILTTEPKDLLVSEAYVRECVWHSRSPMGSFTCTVRTRYRQEPIAAEVEPLTENEARIRFMHPVRAVSPGQWAVFYDGDMVVGGGILRIPS